MSIFASKVRLLGAFAALLATAPFSVSAKPAEKKKEFPQKFATAAFSRIAPDVDGAIADKAWAQSQWNGK